MDQKDFCHTLSFRESDKIIFSLFKHRNSAQQQKNNNSKANEFYFF